MANFHRNSLNVIASDDAVRGVLRLMAENINSQNPNSVDISAIDSAKNTKAALNEVRYQIADGCGFAFGESDGKDIAPVFKELKSEVGTPNYPNQFAFRMNLAFGNLGAAMATSGESQGGFCDDCPQFEISEVEGLTRLSIDYETTWSPNYNDLDALFSSLPKGDYGIVFYDADEYDDYREHGYICGIHHGSATTYGDMLDFENGTKKSAWRKSMESNVVKVAGLINEGPKEPGNKKVKLVTSKMKGEPDYILPNGKMNPMALIWLLQKGYENTRIGWSDESHSIDFEDDDTASKGAKKFVSKRGIYKSLLESVNESLKADSLQIPSEWCLQALVKENNFPNGPADIEVLLFLCAVGMWEAEETAENAYRITYDERLSRGVPFATQLLARLVWYLRDYAKQDAEFVIEFVPTTLDKLEDRMNEFEGVVYCGVENAEPESLHVSSRPEVDLTLLASERPFDGGYPSSLESFTCTFDRSAVNDKALFENNLRSLISRFPVYSRVYGGVLETEHAEDRMKLVAGDLVTLVSEWGTPEKNSLGDVVTIKAFDRDKKEIGKLRERAEKWEFGPNDFGYRELACLLPWITASIKTVHINTKDVEAIVGMDFDAKGQSVDQIVEEVFEGMKCRYSERIKLSRGPLVASDVLEDSPVKDIDNPAPEGADAPTEPRIQVCDNIIALVGKGTELLPIIKKMGNTVIDYCDRENKFGFFHSRPDMDEFKSTRSFEKAFEAVSYYVNDNFACALSGHPMCALQGGEAASRIFGDSKAHIWVISFNTWNSPNDVDLIECFDSLKSGKAGVARIYKREGEKAIHISTGEFIAGEALLADILSNEQLKDAAELKKISEDLGSLTNSEKDRAKLALGYAANEAEDTLEVISGQYVRVKEHSVFDPDSQPLSDWPLSAVAPSVLPEEPDNSDYDVIEPERIPTAEDSDADWKVAAKYFSSHYIGFTDDGIEWDGSHHSVEELGSSGLGRMNMPMAFTSNLTAHGLKICQILNKLEDDNSLIVPRGDIRPELYEAIREGDLTGITLFNLMDVVGAYKMYFTGDENEFKVLFDSNVARGIPGFFSLVSKMVRTLRVNDDNTEPFIVDFAVVEEREENAEDSIQSYEGTVDGGCQQLSMRIEVDESGVISEIGELNDEAVQSIRSLAVGAQEETQKQAEDTAASMAEMLDSLNQLKNLFGAFGL